MTHRRNSERAKSEREAIWFGTKAIDAIKANEAKRSLGGKR